MNLLNAPEQGILYALYMDKVVYRPYKREEIEKDENLTKNLLEMHLFDADREYRYIKKRNGSVEICIDDTSVAHDDCYTERIYTLEDQAETLDDKAQSKYVEVVNYITYDENDLMTITNYRLKEVAMP